MSSFSGTVIGRSREISPDRVIYVSPRAYAELPVQAKHQTARTIGRLVNLTTDGARFLPERLLSLPNRLCELLGDAESQKLDGVIHVVDFPPGRAVLAADAQSQRWTFSLRDEIQP